MAKDKLSEYDATAANNTVVGDVNLAENSCLPSDVNNAIREVMSHQKEAFGSATPLFVDQTNNRLGIGDAAPDTPLHITKTINTAYSATNTTSNSNNLLKLENNSSTAGVFAGIMFRTGSGADGGLNWVQESGNDGSFTFTNQNSTDVEMVRIQSNSSSGSNLLVGTTTNDLYDSTSETGSQISDGYLAVARASTVAYFNRLTSDGEVVDFRKGGSSVGSIKAGNGDLLIGTGAVNLRFFDATPAVIPRTAADATSNGVIDLGNTSNHFQNAYFTSTVFAEAFTGRADTDTAIQMTGSDHMKFFTGGGERMRVNASGHINIGQTSTNIPGQGNSQAGTSLRSVGDAYFSRDGDLALNVNRNGSDGKVVSFRRGGTEGGSISVTTTSATLASSSDARLKSNIEDAASASDKIDAIQVRQFDWNETGDHQDYGLIAQELQAIEPLAVVGSPDSEEMMGVDNSKLIPMLIKEIQSLRSRVATLEAN